MTNVLLRKSFLVKLLAVVVTVALMLTVAPFAEIANFALTANAEEEYDYKKFGTVTPVGNNKYTAEGNNAGIGFRGWFKDGKEVSYEKTIDLTNFEDKDINNYTPMFYNFNLIADSGFENGNTNGWVNASSSSTVKRSGENSLKINANSSVVLENLELHTQYTISVYCYQSSATNFRATVSAKNANDKDDVIVSKAVTGVPNSWQEVTVTFCTVNNPSATFKLEGASANTYLDDFSLIKDVTASPTTYFNDDFTVNRWNVADENKIKIETLGEGANSYLHALTVEDKAPTTKYIYSSPFLVKKGIEYTLSFDLEFTEIVRNEQVQIFLSYTPGADDRYSYVSSKSKWYFGGKKVSNVASKTGIELGSFVTFSPKNDDNSLKNGKLVVNFDAHDTSAIYLNINFQGKGEFNVSNLTIVENNFNASNYVKEQSLAHVGSAIRTNGVQGLRYKTEIDKHFLTAENEAPYNLRFIEYGTLAIKTEYLNSEKLELGKTYTYNNKTKTPGVGVAYSFKDGINKIFEEDANKIYFTGVLTGIGTKNYNTSYTARAYFKYVDGNGNEQVIYTPQDEVAIYPVAKAAYSARDINNKLVENETVRKYLLNNIISRFTDKSITINSDINKAINSNFQGISSTVYHGTIFFEDKHGRKYTDDQAAKEMDRLVDSGITNVRTRLSSKWMWDETIKVEGCSENGGWNWESNNMKAFYKWAKMLQERDITITLNIGWHLVDFTEFYDYHFNGNSSPVSAGSDGHSSIPEVNYLHGYTDGEVKREEVDGNEKLMYKADGTPVYVEGKESKKINCRYGEDDNASKLVTEANALGLKLTTGATGEQSHYSVAAARYAEWGKQALLQLKAHDINNVEYIMPFTETGYYTVKTGETVGVQDNEQDPTYCYDEWIFFTMALHDALEDAGIRETYKLIGPSQSEHAKYKRTENFIPYIYKKIGTSEDYADMIDINSMHNYPSPGSVINPSVYNPDAIYNTAVKEFTHYNSILKDAGQKGKEFWCDEFFVSADDAPLGTDNAMVGTQFAAGFVAGMKLGIDRILSWQMFDTLWDKDATHGTGNPFYGGIHALGTCPRFPAESSRTCNKSTCVYCYQYDVEVASYVPRPSYYALNLLGKHMNGKNGNSSVFETTIKNIISTENSLFTSAIKRSDGKTVILIVNTSDTVTTVNVNSGIAKGSFDRYLYDPNEIEPTPDATSIPSDKSIAVVAGSFHDAIPAQSFAIYVQSDVQYGDVDMDGGNLFD